MPESHPHPKTQQHNPRWWVLGAGLWIALCYTVIILSIMNGNIATAFLAFIAIAPVGLVWRIIYWIQRKTPYINVKERGFHTGMGPTRDEYDEILRHEKKTGLNVDDDPVGREIKRRARRDADAEERVRMGFTGQLLRHWYNFSWGAMVVMYFYPLKDAIAELRRWRQST